MPFAVHNEKGDKVYPSKSRKCTAAGSFHNFADAKQYADECKSFDGGNFTVEERKTVYTTSTLDEAMSKPRTLADRPRVPMTADEMHQKSIGR